MGAKYHPLCCLQYNFPFQPLISGLRRETILEPTRRIVLGAHASGVRIWSSAPYHTQRIFVTNPTSRFSQICDMTSGMMKDAQHPAFAHGPIRNISSSATLHKQCASPDFKSLWTLSCCRATGVIPSRSLGLIYPSAPSKERNSLRGGAGQ